MANMLLFPSQLLLLVVVRTTAAMARSDTLHPHCQESCGNFSIPNPFGIGPGCYRDKSFNITCKPNRENGTMMPHSGGVNSTLLVFDLSVSQSKATMLKHLRYTCYNATGVEDQQLSGLRLRGTPFTISATDNKFTAIGCNTMAQIYANNNSYKSGCMAFCNSDDLQDSNLSGPCTGTGCCQTSLPENIKDYGAEFFLRPVNDSTWRFNPCSYSFVAAQDWFRFDVSSYACRSSNSDCHDSPRGLGYTCNCSRGYEGNPYLEDGCRDIQECDHLDVYPCYGICENKEGGYTCSCEPGYHSEDPKKTECVPNPSSNSLPLWVKAALGKLSPAF